MEVEPMPDNASHDIRIYSLSLDGHRQVVGEGYTDPGSGPDQAKVTAPVTSAQAWNARARAR
jgi:hypothetical protein